MKFLNDIKKIAGLLILLSFFIGATSVHDAHASGPFTDFGGIVTAMIPCTCTPTFFWLFVVNPDTSGAMSTGSYIWGPSTILHDNFGIFPGASLLGDYIPGTGGICYLYAGTTCVTLNADKGLIYETGTGIQPF